MSKRIYEKAREIGIENKELLNALRELGFDIKTASSSFTDEMNERIKDLDFGKSSQKESADIPKKVDIARDARREAILKRMMGKTGSKPASTRKTVESEPPSDHKETPSTKHSVPKTSELELKPKPKKRKKLKPLRVMEKMTPKDLAKTIDIPVSEVLKGCMTFGVMATSNQRLGLDVIEAVCEELGYFAILVSEEGFYAPPILEKIIDEKSEDKTVGTDGEEVLPIIDIGRQKKAKKKKKKRKKGDKAGASRAPIVTVMGHVDHGKTTLLDYIRNAHVVAGEKGGITQHIGAYEVKTDSGNITFIDTPGHEAFTAMRARGAQFTDIVILVVAQDDGLMPQTKEAINHARAADVPIIIAINKMDLPAANADKVKNELAQNGIMVEDWGGDTLATEISALAGDGVSVLLEQIALQAEMMELTAEAEIPANGVVVEALLDKFRGATATILILEGTLKQGDSIVVGSISGRIRSMEDERGKRLKEAGPSTPVIITGLDGVPQAGDLFEVLPSDSEARKIAEERRKSEHVSEEPIPQKMTLEDFFALVEGKEAKELPVVLKADVDGSLEAVKNILDNLGNDEVSVNTIYAGVGAINENDVLLASASTAIVLGFNVKPDNRAKKASKKEGVDIQIYDIIYELKADIKASLEGMLEPEMIEERIGTVEIRQVFQISKVGKIAGSFVQDGEVRRNSNVEIVRAGEVIGTGKISQLKRFKDDVKEVSGGFECGIEIEGFKDYQEGDILNVFETKKIIRRLG